MTRAVAYLRVSTDKQAERGMSMEVQQSRVRAYAGLYEIALVDVISDAGHSAKSLKRPGLQRALGVLRAGHADALLVAKLDRLTRSVADLGQLVTEYFAEGKWSLLSVGDQIDTRSAAGRLVLNVLGSVSQWEREAISERTTAAMRHLREKGRYCGGRVPFGLMLAADGTVQPDDNERAMVARARELRASGLSQRKLARQLEAEGFRSRSGRPFGVSQVQCMLVTRAVAYRQRSAA
jgi:DNA invertase Pin-like site-specific DNA recombinase